MMCLMNPFQKFLNPLIVDAADFDGTNDYMLRGGALTGVADSGDGIFSAWVRIDALPAVVASICGSNRFYVNLASTGGIVVRGLNSAGAIIFNIYTSPYSAGATWLHILSSWSNDLAASHLYISDVSDKVADIEISGVIDHTTADFAIGNETSLASKFNGCIADLYFAPGQYLDFSIEGERRKFIKADGSPQHLGSEGNGSSPTGTAPAIYLHLDDGEAVANFATNRGTGGNFSITGTLATASTSPSD